MVYKRSYKKRSYKKKPTAWYNKKYSVGDMAATAYKGVKTLQGIINSEKHFVVFGASVAATTTANVISLSAITQDDTFSGRTGNSILSKSLTGKLQFVLNNAATTTVTRVIIFEDLQQVADTAPVASTLLESDYLSSLTLSTLGRYKILMDKSICQDNVSNKLKVLPVNLRFDHHIRYNGSASSDIQKGGIYMMVLSNEATNGSSFTYNLRLGYYDN